MFVYMFPRGLRPTLPSAGLPPPLRRSPGLDATSADGAADVPVMKACACSTTSSTIRARACIPDRIPPVSPLEQAKERIPLSVLRLLCGKVEKGCARMEFVSFYSRRSNSNIPARLTDRQVVSMSAGGTSLTKEQQQRIALNKLLAFQRRTEHDLAKLAGELEQHRGAQLARGRVYLNCPFSEKEDAKACGARWDVDKKMWYIEDRARLAKVVSWLRPQDKQALMHAREQEERLRSQQAAILRDWPACNQCAGRLNSSWPSCPTCDIAAQYFVAFKKQASQLFWPSSGGLDPIAQVRATVLTHFCFAQTLAGAELCADLPSPRKTTVIARQVRQSFQDLLLRPRGNLTLSAECPQISSVRMKELGDPAKLAGIAAVLEHASSRGEVGIVIQCVEDVLQEQEDWQRACELLSSTHLAPSERNISDEQKIKMLVRLAELYLEDNDVSNAGFLIRHVEDMDKIQSTSPPAPANKYALLKLRARLCEMQGTFSDAARHYVALSESALAQEGRQEEGRQEGRQEAERWDALTKAAFCSILALRGPSRTQCVAQCVAVLLQDGRAHQTVLLNVLTAILSGQLVHESETEELERMLLQCRNGGPKNCFAPTGAQKTKSPSQDQESSVEESSVEESRVALASSGRLPLTQLLRNAIKDHNDQVRERDFLASGRCRGLVKCWNEERGFGFIAGLSSTDIFCHVSDITDGDMLREGRLVEYKVESDVKGPRAVCVTGGCWLQGNGVQTVRKRKREDAEPAREPPMESPHQHHPPAFGLEGRGYWVLREEFTGRKSFGCFRCHVPDCGKTWSSAHAFREYRQGCDNCETDTFPCCMWFNDPQYEEIGTRGMRGNESEHHHTARCEACKHGVCSMRLLQ